MKHLTLVAGFVTSLSLPVLAQPQPPIGGPIELHNPHRRGGGGPMGGGGGFADMTPGAPGNGFWGGNPAPNADVPTAPIAPPSVAMFVDGPYLFVLRGDSLYQFDKKTLKLINSTQLPMPVAPTPPAPTTTPAQNDVRTQTSPPLRPGPNF